MDPTAEPATDPLTRRAERRVRLKLGFLMHALVFVLVNLGLALVWYLGDWAPGWPRWPGGSARLPFPLWGWALGLTIHGIVVLVRLSGDGLRQRMIDREVQALRQRDPRG